MELSSFLMVYGPMLILFAVGGFCMRARCIDNLVQHYYRGEETIANRFMPNMDGSYMVRVSRPIISGLNPISLEYHFIPLFNLAVTYVLLCQLPNPTDLEYWGRNAVLFCILMLLVAVNNVRYTLRQEHRPVFYGSYVEIYNMGDRNWLTDLRRVAFLESLAMSILGFVIITILVAR